MQHHPDYEQNSIVNLMASLLDAFGNEPPSYRPFPGLPPDPLKDSRNVVTLVIDGLGHDYLQREGVGGHLHANISARLTSVFPSTTASAMTTFLTGLAPQQHGLTGWFMYFREIGAVTTVLPYRPRYGSSCLASDGIDPRVLFRHGNLFDRLDRQCHLVLPAHIAGSAFTQAHQGSSLVWPYQGFEELCPILERILGDPTPKYVHAYWPGFDALAHEYGIGSSRLKALLEEIDSELGRFCRRLEGSDTLLMVTADHGLIDTSPEHTLRLEEHPELADCLLLPLCGEPRVAYCYIHPDRIQDFDDYVTLRLGHCADAYGSMTLLDSGLFGLGRIHPRLRDRIGHRILVMRDNYTIRDRILGERSYPLIGVHGGLSAEEMYVPLILWRG